MPCCCGQVPRAPAGLIAAHSCGSWVVSGTGCSSCGLWVCVEPCFLLGDRCVGSVPATCPGGRAGWGLCCLPVGLLSAAGMVQNPTDYGVPQRPLPQQVGTDLGPYYIPLSIKMIFLSSYIGLPSWEFHLPFSCRGIPGMCWGEHLSWWESTAGVLASAASLS